MNVTNHNRGHTLEVIITGAVPVSDHKAVTLSLMAPTPLHRPKRTIHLKNNESLFLEHIQPTFESDCSELALSDMVNLYNSTSTTLNIFAPEKNAN
jgi:hypothetical protein